DYLGAQYVAERIRKAVQEKMMKIYDTTINVTISVGVSNYPKDSEKMNDLIDKADFALYRAKKYGRNRVLCFAELSVDKE
ncbi:MAG TPA: diguanylate cyclase, partial [Candidatus Omnitrophota bacterium]|nr:diguanylate cyclase [Candidatus Omnitrophota bacterium]